MDFYSNEELKTLLGSVGEEVKIHRSAVFFNSKNIFLQSHIRIDCFAIISAGEKGIFINDYTHIAASTHLFGSGGAIHIGAYANLSSRVSLFTASDDYTEGYMTNPLIPTAYKKVEKGDVTINNHAIIGCGSVVLPGIDIGWGGSVGALSLVNRSIQEREIVAGIPCRFIKWRNERLHTVEHAFALGGPVPPIPPAGVYNPRPRGR